MAVIFVDDQPVNHKLGRGSGSVAEGLLLLDIGLSCSSKSVQWFLGGSQNCEKMKKVGRKLTDNGRILRV